MKASMFFNRFYQLCVCHTRPVPRHSNSWWVTGSSNLLFFAQVTVELELYVFAIAVDRVCFWNLYCLLHVPHLSRLHGLLPR